MIENAPFYGFVTILLTIATISDFYKKQQIPDWIHLAIIAGALVNYYAFAQVNIMSVALIGIGGMLIGTFAFVFGYWGGGDAKLFTSMSFAIPFLLIPFTMNVLLFNGILHGIIWVANKVRLKRDSKASKLPVPAGIIFLISFVLTIGVGNVLTLL